ncbi:HNH homing endonuclease [Bacillus phage vB_BanH_McCartney]|nr:HNH homing endonuclease [Bacillus phage vB_BanH_McCartney]
MAKRRINTDDYIGKKYNRLTIISYVGVNKQGYKTFKCTCECGAEKNVTLTKLKRGDTKSCGCLTLDRTKETNIKHGKRHTRLYNIWRGMKLRCDNENDPNYINYGGRGIAICNEWYDFETFYTWATGHGYADNLTIERVDVNQGYYPENCTWANATEQSRNRRSNKYITLFEETKTLVEWLQDERTAMSRDTYNARVRKGWSPEKSLTTPVKKYKRNV